MKDIDVVRIIEPYARIEKLDDGWIVRRRPEGQVLGGGVTPERAWHSARMTLFGGSIREILSEIPVMEK